MDPRTPGAGQLTSCVGPRAARTILAVGLDRATIEGLRAMIRAGGARQLTVGDLRAGEVAELTWSGSPAHLRSVAAALQRAGQGLEDYLVVRAPGGEPVAKMRIDYSSEAGTGVFSQLATMRPPQGPGYCHHARRRGRAARPCPRPGVRRARRRGRQPQSAPPYQRLGYRATGRQHAAWETEDDAGVLRVYETTLTIPRKRL
jgi:hypothetical protein